MKKAILILVLAVAQLCCAQYVDVTPAGVSGAAEFKTATNMHAETKEYLIRKYSPHAIVSTTNYLRVSGFTPNAVIAKKGMFKEAFHVRYTIVFEFTDTTVKVYFSDVGFQIARRITVEPRLTFQGRDTFAVFYTDGRVKSDTTKINIEMFFDSLLNQLNRELYAGR